uniref:Uncharacterized protein n=1 Tax=viral metagenome TaxID=1070528 RepID=A0A6C0LYB1_9ZZZZ
MQVETFDGCTVCVSDYIPIRSTKYADSVREFRTLYDSNVHEAIIAILRYICKDTSSMMADVCVKENGRSMRSIAFATQSSVHIENNPILSQRGIFLQPLIKKRVIISYNIAQDKRVPKSAICSKWPPQLSFCGILLFDNDTIVGQMSLLGQKTMYRQKDIEEMYPLTELLEYMVGEERRKRTVRVVVDEMLRRRTAHERANEMVLSAARVFSESIKRDDALNVEEEMPPCVDVEEEIPPCVDVEEEMSPQEIVDSPSLDGSQSDSFGVSLSESQTDTPENEQSDTPVDEQTDTPMEPFVSGSELVFMMSHEIRTPLNSIVGMTSLIPTAGDLNDKQKDYLNILQGSVYHLMDVVNDILDYGKLTANRMVLKAIEYNLRTVIAEAVDIVSFKLRERNVEIEIDIDSGVPTKLIGDSTRLRQVFINLLYNAIKYTEDGTIKIVVTSELVSVVDDDAPMSKAYYIEVSIVDTGIGIIEEELPYVFSMYNSLSTQKENGAGLGLSISREIVRLMGGEMVVSSDGYGCGSTFSFGFESTESFKLEDLLNKYSKLLTDRDILVLDSNRANRMYLTDILCQWRMRPTMFDIADEAIHRIKISRTSGAECPFSVCLVDFEVGNEFATYMSNEYPSVALIAIAQKGVNSELYDEYVDIPLNKPYKLMVAIARSLSKSRRDSTQPKTTTYDSVLPTQEDVHILLAEDNSINAFMMKEMLRSIGYTNANITWVQNGKECVDELQSHKYDICLMDIRMPVLDGIEATKIIKRGANVPVIVAMTALTIDEVDAKWYDAILTKPIDIPRLEAILKKYHL